MSLPFEIEKNIAIIRAEIEKNDVDLVDITFRRMGSRHVLTITADKAGGITLDDCAQINHRLSIFLDEMSQEGTADPLLQGPYDLEVVSPGLDRPLTTQKDFTKAVGEVVRMTFKKEGDHIATWMGKIISVCDEGVELELKDKARKLLKMGQILHAHREIKIKSKG